MSPVDEELLSAYLDGALSDSERTAFEGRLAREPALQTALNDLRRMAVILKAAPQLAPPRNFTLDPALYGRRPARLPVRWLQLGAGLAAILLVISVAVLVNSTNRQTGQTAGGAAVAGLSTVVPSRSASAAKLATAASESIAAEPTATASILLAAATPLAISPTAPPTLAALFAQATQLATATALQSPTNKQSGTMAATQAVNAGAAAPIAPSNGNTPSDGVTTIPPAIVQATSAAPRMLTTATVAAVAQASGSADNAISDRSLLLTIINFFARLLRILFSR